MKGPFSDLKVIELANVLAGPAAGMFFAELGAQVIKIENSVSGGDVTRSWRGPGEPADTTSAYYASVNWNKQSVFVNMKNGQDREKVLELIRSADVVISNYKSGDDKKLGMDYSTLSEINPGLVYAHLTGFGEDSSRIAYDLVLQAETGFMHVNGTPESGPLKMPVALIDVLAAHQLKEGILVALMQKMKTGKGAHVRVSLFDAAIASLANRASNYLMLGRDPGPEGSLHPNIAPYGEHFYSADGKAIVLAVGDNRQFSSLCEVLGLGHLPEDERFRSNQQRVVNRVALASHLREQIQGKTALWLREQFLEAGIPFGIIRSVGEALGTEEADRLVIRGDGAARVRTAVFTIS